MTRLDELGYPITIDRDAAPHVARFVRARGRLHREPLRRELRQPVLGFHCAFTYHASARYAATSLSGSANSAVAPASPTSMTRSQ